MTDIRMEEINRIATAVAKELSTEGGPPPVIRIGDLDAGSLTGSVDVEIEIGATTYILVVQMPTDANQQEYVFSLKMKSGEVESTLASFKYKSDGTGWGVTVGLPRIEIGSVIIKKVEISLGQGSV